MIAYLQGTVISKGPQDLIISVNGVGYKIAVTKSFWAKIQEGQEVCVHTHLQVAENVLDLYGFQTKEELTLFKHIINVSGVGPKSALGILDLGEPGQIISAISQEQVQYISRASGIGAKTAKKIIVELQNKVWDIKGVLPNMPMDGNDEVIEGLRVLGYQIPQIQEALKQIPKDLSDAQGKVKAALQILGGK